MQIICMEIVWRLYGGWTDGPRESEQRNEINWCMVRLTYVVHRKLDYILEFHWLQKNSRRTRAGVALAAWPAFKRKHSYWKYSTVNYTLTASGDLQGTITKISRTSHLNLRQMCTSLHQSAGNYLPISRLTSGASPPLITIEGVRVHATQRPPLSHLIWCASRDIQAFALKT